MKRLLVLLAWLLIASTVSAVDQPSSRPAEEPQSPPPPFVKGREFAYRLVKGMNLAQALPKKPVEADLFAILSGERTRTVEAEDSFDARQDRVTFRSFNVLGPFSGRGWLIGTSEPTPVNLRTMILRPGTYTISMRGTRKGHLLSIGGKAFRVDFDDNRLSDVEVGKLHLDAGPLAFSDVLPPDGVIDVVRLTAPPLAPIEPFGGWRPDREITFGEAAEVAALVMQDRFTPPPDPETPPLTIPLVGTISLPGGTTQTTATIYGRFLGPAWIRNGLAESSFELPFTLPSNGFYSLEIHWMGRRISGAVDGRVFSSETRDYLHWYDAGIHYLKGGSHTLSVRIPPMGGVDAVRITRRMMSTPEIMKFLGWKEDPSSRIPREESERVLRDILSRFSPEKWL